MVHPFKVGWRQTTASTSQKMTVIHLQANPLCWQSQSWLPMSILSASSCKEKEEESVVCELSPTLTSNFSTRDTMCRSQKLIFKKAGTLMILMCTKYFIQVFKIRSVLCREQSGVYVAITMDQLLNNTPLGTGGYAIFHEPSLLLDLSKTCWDVQTTWKPTLDDCAKSGRMYSIETLVSTRSYHIVSALSSTASSRCTCNVPSKMTANLDIRTAIIRQSPCSTAVVLFLAALLTEVYFFLYTVGHAACCKFFWESGCTSPRRTSPGW